MVDVLVAVCLAQRGEHPGPIRLNLHDQPCCADVASRLRALGVDVDGGWQSLCLDNSPPVWRGDDEAFVQGAPVWPAPPGVRPHIREYGYVVRRTPGGWRVVEQRTLLMT